MSDDTPSERLIRIETKVDMLLTNEVDKERRIRLLERRDAYVVGACTVLSIIMPIIVKKLGFL